MLYSFITYFNGFYTLNLREKQFFLSRLDDEFEIDVAYKAVIDHRNKYGSTEASELEMSPPTINLDQGLALYKQQNSKSFWCRVKLPKKNSGYHRQSTKMKTVREASMAAIAIRIEALAKFEAGTLKSQVKHTWSNVCHQTINQLKAEAKIEIEKGNKRPSQGDYASIIENYLLPFPNWEQKNVKDIEYPELMQMKKVFDAEDMAKTTATKRKTAIGFIFEYMRIERILTSSQIPDIPKFAWVAGAEGKTFEMNDRNIIMDNFHNFLESSRNNKITRHKRKILPLYFNLLVLTGMRPGAEVMEIKWKDLFMGTFKINNKALNAVSLKVTSGKKSKVVKARKKKERISRNFLIDAKAATTLEQLYYLSFGIEKTINEIISEKREDKMFLGYQGREPDLESSFKQYVSIYLKGKLSDYYTLYSARHEFINVKLEEGMEISDISALCGNNISTIEIYYMKFRSMMRAARILTDEDIKKFNPEPNDVKSA